MTGQELLVKTAYYPLGNVPSMTMADTSRRYRVAVEDVL
jgi:hypothetical protein